MSKAIQMNSFEISQNAHYSNSLSLIGRPYPNYGYERSNKN